MYHLYKHKEKPSVPLAFVIFPHLRIMDNKTIIDRYKKIHDAEAFLGLLNAMKIEEYGEKTEKFSTRDLKVFIWPNNPERYSTFTIPKKSGGVRHISKPCPKLKYMLRYVKQFLQAFYNPMPCVQGFTTGRSVVGNAGIHLHQNYVYNVDLSDFFPSISQGRVWKRLQLPPYNFPVGLCNIIAGLACAPYETPEGVKYNALPQGAPTSPILSNIVCEQLDRRLTGLAKRFGLHYSRYADDMTFSSMHNVYQDNSEFIRELQRLITQQGFRFNEKKTRLQIRGSRQEVTGLTVGTKVNVSRRYIKELRSVLHVWEKFGYSDAFAWFYSRYKRDKGSLKKGEPVLEQVIEGKLNYLKMVKGNSDSTYKTLAGRFEACMTALDEERPKHGKRNVLVSYELKDFSTRFSNVSMDFSTSPDGIVSGSLTVDSLTTPIYFDKIFRKLSSANKAKVLKAISQGISDWFISEIEYLDKRYRNKFNHFWLISRYRPHQSTTVDKSEITRQLLELWGKDGLDAAVEEWKKFIKYDPSQKSESMQVTSLQNPQNVLDSFFYEHLNK